MPERKAIKRRESNEVRQTAGRQSVRLDTQKSRRTQLRDAWCLVGRRTDGLCYGTSPRPGTGPAGAWTRRAPVP